jgi:hypothetical protein
MKKMVKMAVLLATLLMLTGVAFADECYEITCIGLDYDFQLTHNVYFDPYNGSFNGLCATQGGMSLFYDSMKLQAIIEGSSIDGYLKFHGDDFHVVSGIVYCMGGRFTVRGHKVDYDECPDN